MSYRYHVLTSTERINHMIFVLCALIIGALFAGTALLFDAHTPEIAFQQIFGVIKGSPIPDMFPSNADIDSTQLPHTFASLVFLSLAGLLALFAIRSTLVAMFSTIAFLEIVVLLGAVYLLLVFGYSFFQTFAKGGVFGLWLLLVLIVECGIFGYPSYRIIIRRLAVMDRKQYASDAPWKLRVAAYASDSTDLDDQKRGFTAQIEHYTEVIQKNPDWVFVGLYADKGISGTKRDKKSELIRLLSDCENGKIDLIIIKSISRFARDNTDCREIVQRLAELSVYILFEKENIDTRTFDSELVLTILSSLSAEENISLPTNNK